MIRMLYKAGSAPVQTGATAADLPALLAAFSSPQAQGHESEYGQIAVKGRRITVLDIKQLCHFGDSPRPEFCTGSVP